MSQHPPDAIDHLLLDRLTTAGLSDGAENVVVAALLGQDELDAALGGTPPPRTLRTPPDGAAEEPIGTYLTDIEVTGFRGVGTTATLQLVPGPGLTIVTGRNGSGKSSFAEAAELALTGKVKRWADRTTVWRDGWRNVHHPDPARIRVRLGVDGKRSGAVVEYSWAAGARLDDATSFLQVLGEPRQPVGALGWGDALTLYRPFLSYAELGELINGKPSEAHDALRGILGLGRLVEVETMLKTARKAMDDRQKAPVRALPALRDQLAAHPDPRARQAENILAARHADLDQLAALTVTDEAGDDPRVPALRQLASLTLPEHGRIETEVDRLRRALAHVAGATGSEAEQARTVGTLLRQALEHYESHPDQPCPVCGARTLDAGWAAQAREQLRDLSRRAEELEAAHRDITAARTSLRDALPRLPAVLTSQAGEDIPTDAARIAWQHWDQALVDPSPATLVESLLPAYDQLATALQPVREAARTALDQRAQAWQPVAHQLADWIEAERTGRQAAVALGWLRPAITWLTSVSDEVRNENLRPIVAKANAIWEKLRQGSDVEISDIRLAGTGTSRRIDISVAVNQVDGGAALGVMSQGELHSLGLGLFLPRATRPESPFRFLLIDDPVQAMDPAKVYGLAEVLADIATTRQVIVFTHDDRLPTAARHLGLDARILAVGRASQSQVTVRLAYKGDPAARYLSDADAIANDDTIDLEVRGRVTANLVRDAIESTCHDFVRRREHRAGTAVQDTEDRIAEAQGLRETLALALLSDRGRVGDLGPALGRLDHDANWLVTRANRGAHGGPTDPVRLVRAARRLVSGITR